MKSKLKIIIPVVVAIVIVVGVVVFISGKSGNKIKGITKMSKEEMIENSSNLSLDKLDSAMAENSLNATEEYMGKIYQYTGAISKITENYVSLNSRINVYLSKEEIRQLKNNQVIVVVGELQQKYNIYELKNAYFITDSIDIRLGVVGVATEIGNPSKKSNDCKITTSQTNSADFYYYLEDYADIITDNGQKIELLGGVNIIGAKAVMENARIMIKSYDTIEAISPKKLKEIAETLSQY